MDRIKISLPREPGFEMNYRVTVADINYGGHLSNDAVLRIAHEARIQFLEAHGMSEMNIGGNGIIMTDAVIQYNQEAFRGDLLIVRISPGEITKRGFELFYHLVLAKSNTTVAKLKTGQLYYNYEHHKISSVSEDILAKLKSIGK